MADYKRLVAQESLILEATEEVCRVMEPSEDHYPSQGVTRKELAQRLGCGKSHITQLLSGERNLTLRTLADIASALGQKVSIELSPFPAEPGEKSPSS